MRRRLLLSLILACAAASGTAAGGDRAPPETATVAADRSGVDYLVGRWRVEARDPQTGEVLVADYRVERAPGGAWLLGAGLSDDGVINARDTWGRDPLTGEIMRLIFDASGTFGTIRSPGWRGDTLVLEGEARSKGGVVRVRESITRLGPDAFRAVWEAHRDGAWTAYSVETVTRTT